MRTPMPVLETARLRIRPFALTDLDAIHRILSVAFPLDLITRDVRAQWLQWAVLNDEQLAKLGQPPYGDRAVVLRQTDQLIGSVGFVPCLALFDQLPSFHEDDASSHLTSTEFGMFWAFD